MELTDLKAQAYDLLYAIEVHQNEINELKKQLIEINQQIAQFNEEK